MDELNFTFKMPDDETLAKYISIKGEKGEAGDPTKLSQLENDTGFITASTDALTNYYTKAQTDSAIDADVEALKTELGVPDGFFTNASETITGEGSSITLTNTTSAVFKEIKLYGDTEQEGTPTPDNPVDVQVVTGNQIIVISDNAQQSQSYTLSLGDLELCELGNYRDHIYKSGNKWYKHKEVGKYTIDGSESFVWDSSIPRMYLSSSALSALGISCVYPSNNSVVATALSSKFTVKTFVQVYTNKQGGFAMSATGRNWQFSSLDWEDEADALSDMTGTIVYYALAAPVEEEITDETMIAQLEAIDKARSYNETTVISVSGSLATLLSVEAFKNNWYGTVSGLNVELEDLALEVNTEIGDLTAIQNTKADKAVTPYYFDSVEDMLSYELSDGDFAITTGFYSANDGGGAFYKITTSGTADNYFKLALSNGNIAEMIVSDPVDIRKIGATTSSDAHDYILAVVNNNYECIIPSGRWQTSPIQIAKYDSARIKGQPIYGNNNSNGTILTPVSDQDYILKVGYDNTTSIANDISISNIQFNTNGYQVINAVLFSRVQFSKFDELCFRNCKCSDCAFRIRETWENDFGRIMFRATDAPYSLIFGDKIGTGNISTNYFKYLSFEGSRGSCVKFEDDCAYAMNTIDTIDFESGTAAFSDETRVSISTVNDYTALAVIELNNGHHSISINNLNLNNIAMHAYTNNATGISRAFDRVIEGKATDAGYISVAINSITGTGYTNPPILVNATRIDKFYCLSNVFEGGQTFICNVDGCRLFKYLPSEFCDNFFMANIDRAYRDLKIAANKPSCVGTDRAVRVASLKKIGDTLYFHAKGTGQVWYGSAHISATDASNFAWYALDISSITNGSSNNLQISTNAAVEVDDYYIA